MIKSFKTVIISILLFVVIIRMGLPHTKYIFYPVIAISTVIALIFFRTSMRKLLDFSVFYWLVLINTVFFLFALVITKSIHLSMVKEGINLLIIVLVGYLLVISLDGEQGINLLYDKLLSIIIYSSLGLAIAGLIKLLLEFGGVYLPFLYYDNSIIESNLYPRGTSLMPDNNYFALILIFGIVSLIYNIFSERIKLKNSVAILILTLESVCIFLSLSRRATLLLNGILLISALIITVWYFGKSSGKKLIPLNSGKASMLLRVLVLAFSLQIALGGLIFMVGSSGKVKSVHKLGLDLQAIQNFSTSLALKYGSVFGISNESKAFSSIWHGNLDPLSPESGWGNGDYMMVSDLKSLGLNNIPRNAKGILIDSTCNSLIWSGIAYYSSNIRYEYLRKDMRYNASVYCFVSDDFDGDKVCLFAQMEGRARMYSYYDLERKGTWQRLAVDLHGENTFMDFLLYFNAPGRKSFRSLRGNVIFAYPEFTGTTFNPYDPVTWKEGNVKVVYPLEGINASIVPPEAKGYMIDRSAFVSAVIKPGYQYASSYIIFGDSLVRRNYSIISEIFCFVSPDFTGNLVMLSTVGGAVSSQYDLTKRNCWQKLKINVAGDDNRVPVYMYVMKDDVTDFSKLEGYVIFACPTYKVIKESYSQSESLTKELTKRTSGFSYASIVGSFNLTKKFGETDEQDPEKSDSTDKFLVNPSMDAFYGTRSERWRYGWFIYMNQYNGSQRIIGGGFDYMTSFSKKFMLPDGVLDYPHNPMISVLLYSGILGFCFYIWLLFRTTLLYFRNLKAQWYLIVCYLITFVFTFFSGNNPLDPSIMGFFVMLPFVISFISGKDNSVKKRDMEPE